MSIATVPQEVTKRTICRHRFQHVPKNKHALVSIRNSIVRAKSCQSYHFGDGYHLFIWGWTSSYSSDKRFFAAMLEFAESLINAQKSCYHDTINFVSLFRKCSSATYFAPIHAFPTSILRYRHDSLLIFTAVSLYCISFVDLSSFRDNFSPFRFSAVLLWLRNVILRIESRKSIGTGKILQHSSRKLQ